MNLVTRYFTKNPYAKDGRYLTGADFRGFFLHSIAVAQPSPEVMRGIFDQSNYTAAGINGFIGADAVIVTAPCLETPGKVKRMPHAGSPANNHYIGFELCEPKQLKYNASHTAFTVDARDLAAAKSYVMNSYRNAVEFFAGLCLFHGKDPLADGVILSHKEGASRGIATRHSDPEHLWNGLNMGYTMDTFRTAVAAKITELTKPKEEIDMTKAEVEQLIDQRIEQAVGKYIKEIGDIPHESVKAEVRALLDCGAINGGTTADVNPDDIHMSYDNLRGVVMAKRYIDHRLGG